MPDIRDVATQRAHRRRVYKPMGELIRTGGCCCGILAASMPGETRTSLVANSGVQAMILERNEDIAADKRIADMEEINAFWTETMRDEARRS